MMGNQSNYMDSNQIPMRDSCENVDMSVCGQFDDSPEDEVATFLRSRQQYPSQEITHNYTTNARDSRYYYPSEHVEYSSSESNVAVEPAAYQTHSDNFVHPTIAGTFLQNPKEVKTFRSYQNNGDDYSSVQTNKHSDRTISPTFSYSPSRPDVQRYDHAKSSSFANNVITDITDSDVLCGRGVRTNNHKGNHYFRYLIDNYREEYFSARKQRKTQISRCIVHAIRTRIPSGRFLKRSSHGDMWYEIGEQKAMEKASQALREGSAQQMRDIRVAMACNKNEHDQIESTDVTTRSKSPHTDFQVRVENATKLHGTLPTSSSQEKRRLDEISDVNLDSKRTRLKAYTKGA